MRSDSPRSDPETKAPWSPELFTLGLAFIGAGAALGSWFVAFRVVGIGLVLIGLAIITFAAIQPLRWFVRNRMDQAERRRWAPIFGLLLLLTLGGIALVWLRQTREEFAPQLEVSSAPVPEVSCIEAAAECVFTAENRNPGEPLVWQLPASLTAGAADGSLEANAHLEGDVAGRYVAIACRSNSESGEYVLAVRPENRSFRLIRWDGSRQFELAGGRLPQTISPANDANRLNLRCMGSTIMASINGTPVASREDDHQKSGSWYIATGIFMENTQAAPVSARFDHISMTPATPVN